MTTTALETGNRDLVLTVAQIAATIYAARVGAGDRFEIGERNFPACVEEARYMVTLADGVVAEWWAKRGGAR